MDFKQILYLNFLFMKSDCIKEMLLNVSSTTLKLNVYLGNNIAHDVSMSTALFHHRKITAYIDKLGSNSTYLKFQHIDCLKLVNLFWRYEIKIVASFIPECMSGCSGPWADL